MSDLLLAKETLKSGEEIYVYLASNIGDSPVIPVFLRDFSSLVEEGFAHPFIPASNRSKAIYAIIDNLIVGEVIYDFQDDVSKTTWVAFSYVKAEFRRKGIFKILHNYLEQHAKRNQSTRISSFVHVDNLSALESFKSVGRIPVFYKTEKKLS